jgi:predicted RNA-binding protein (virulence factor B family)
MHPYFLAYLANKKEMIQVGRINTLKVLREVDFGVYMDDGKEGILLPKRYVPTGAKVGDMIDVLIYHDSDDRLIATTQKPLGFLDDIIFAKAVTVTPQGAFLDWGLMKDIFVPLSQQKQKMIPNGYYLVKIVLDEQTGRLAATEKIDSFLSNDTLTVSQNDSVKLTVYRRTDIGYVVIINNIHTGVLHFSDIFRNISTGDQFEGFVKRVYEDSNQIDVAAGKKGYQRVEDSSSMILRLLEENEGFLPYHDKSDPDDIYDFFGMSKKTFKMTIGNLYKAKKIEMKKDGIALLK